MINRLLLFSFLFSFSIYGQWDGDDSPDYKTLISIYDSLSSIHDEIEMYNMGNADCGEPIYLVLINAEGDSISSFENARSRNTLLINNAIHAGEPDGINACLIWIDDWIKNGKKTKGLPLIAIIPAYNVGGMLNRSNSSRANQNGPNEYGFRGNAQNLDLNRDFIKMDSKNMFVFAKIFHSLNPEVFIDTHVSNGSDYQYEMTYIGSVKERMSPGLASLMYDDLIPFLENEFEENSFPLIPYVDLHGKTPEEGINAFNDLPRYAMGYASLFNSISFTTETHMLKPFKKRVQATLLFIDETINWMVDNNKELSKFSKESKNWELNKEFFNFNYQLTDQKDSILFHGFDHYYLKSEVTGLEQLRYDEQKPFSKYIDHYNVYKAKDSIEIPKYIGIGTQCEGVIERLKANGVQFCSQPSNQIIKRIRIDEFENPSSPYEGHFLHSQTKFSLYDDTVSPKHEMIYIDMNQSNKRFIMSVLTPSSPDSYFNWNEFDSYVQQKEYFSSYVFEPYAEELLRNNQELSKEFEFKKKNDQEFANSEWSQLYFLYMRSKFFEPSLNMLPIWFIY